MDMTIILARTDRQAPPERIDVDMASIPAGMAFGAVLAHQRRRPGGETWRLDAVEADGDRHEPPANDHGPMEAPRALSMAAAQWAALLELAQAGLDAGTRAGGDAVAAHRLLRTHVLMVERDEQALAQGRSAVL